jgi:hypothetical protein
MVARVLSPTHQAIIRSVARLQMVTSRQLGRLHFSTGAEGSRDSRRTSALKRLSDLGLIIRVQPRTIGGWGSGSEGFTYMPPGKKARNNNPHLLDIAELYVRLVEASRLGLVEIIEGTYEVEALRRIGDISFRPDAYTRLRTPTGRYRWFIEVDRSSEYHNKLFEKVQQYEQVADFWPRDEVCPVVLFTCSDADGYKRVERAIRESRMPGLFQLVMYEYAIPYLVR